MPVHGFISGVSFDEANAVQTPKTTDSADLNPLIDHYKNLKGISYTIVHHGDVGPPTKDIAERVFWAKGQFEISPIAYGTEPAARMAKLVANDGQVNTFALNGNLLTTPLDPGPDSIGAWEARGGLLLVWLMEGKTWKRMTQPQEGVVVKFSLGETKIWHDRPVREIVLSHTTNVYKEAYSIFVSPSGDQLVGTQSVVGNNTIWTEFRDEEAKTP